MGNVDIDLQPHSVEAEEALLGSILIDQDAMYRIDGLVKQGDFYDQRRQWLFWAVKHLVDRGMPADFVSVCDILKRKEKLKDVGAGYIADLVAKVPSSAHAEYYARSVADYAARRKVMAVAADITKHAYDKDSADPIGYAHHAVLGLNGHSTGELAHIENAASSYYDQIEAWSKDPLPFGGVRGMSSGIPSVDYLTDGMQRGDLVVVAGRPSMGKSAISFEMARRIASEDCRVAIFSLEMTREKVLARWAAAVSGVDPKRVQRGLCPDKYRGTRHEHNYYVNEEALAAHLKAIGEVSSIPYLYVDDTPGLSASEIRGRCLSLAHRVGRLDLVVIDHGGLIRSESIPGENTAKTEGRKSQTMKTLAKELDCVSMLLLQLNRGVEGRNDKRPLLSDLRDSGEHEQNVDIALGLYWEAAYNDSIKRFTASGQPNNKWLELEILLLKHRDGVPDRRRVVRYERHLTRFTEWEAQP